MTYVRDIPINGAWDTGLTGTLAYKVTSAGNVTRIARTTSGIVEIGGGAYIAQSVTLDTNWGVLTVTVDDGTNFAVGEIVQDDENLSGSTGASTSSLTRTIKYGYDLNGVPTDVTSVVLEDPTGTFGLRRVDTGEVIVAAGTPLPKVSNGRYELAVGILRGVRYEYYTYVVKPGGGTERTQRFFIASAGSASWYYSDAQGVLDLIRDENLNIEWDLNDTGSYDSALLMRDGGFTDGYINAKLIERGIAAPLVLASNATAAVLLRRASSHLVIFEGFKHRGLRATEQQNTGIADIVTGYKAYADELIDLACTVLSAVNDPTAEFEGGGGVTAITPSLYNNDANRMVSLGCWGGRIPDAVPIW